MTSAAFRVDAGRIRCYADAIHEQHPVYRDGAAARAAGFRDVVAPPMFAVVYAAEAVWAAVRAAVGARLDRVLHGAQELRWSGLVYAGDTITTEARLEDRSERGGMGFYVFASESRNQHGDVVSCGTWTVIVRGGDDAEAG